MAQRAGQWLSSELNCQVSVKTLKIDFFSKVELGGLCLKDQKGDTLFSGEIGVQIRQFDWRHKIIRLRESRISNGVAKLVRYPGEKDFNYVHLLNYFSSDSKTDSTKSNWTFDAGDFVLDGFRLEYDLRERPKTDARQIDWDHIKLSGINGRLNGLTLKEDSICINIQNLSLTEQSGFELESLSGQFTIHESLLRAEGFRIKTRESLLLGDLEFRHQNWKAYSDFIRQVPMRVMLKDSSRIESNDIAFFTEELEGLNQKLALSGVFRGTVSDLRASDLRLSFGRYSSFSGYASITGLPEIENTFLHLDARQLSSHYMDLARIPSYPFHSGKKMEWVESLKKFGRLAYRGKFDGFLSDFTTYGTFRTDIGNMETSLSLVIGPGENTLSYKGLVKTMGLDLGRLLGAGGLGQSNMIAELEGQGRNIDQLAASFRLHVEALQFNGYTYRNMDLNGHFEDKVFNGLLNSLDSNLNLDFNGSIDFNKKVPDVQFISSITRMDLTALRFLNLRDSGIVSGQVFMDTRGNSIDDLSGEVHLDNLLYTVRGRSYKLSSLSLNLEQEGKLKHIELKSAYLNAGMHGKFMLSNLSQVLNGYLYTYYPTFFRKPERSRISEDSLGLSLSIKNFNTIRDLFLPEYFVSKGSKAELVFMARENKLSGSARAPLFKYRNFNFRNVELQVNEAGRILQAHVNSSGVEMNDSSLVDQLSLNLNSGDQSLDYRLNWENRDSLPNFGILSGSMRFADSAFVLACDSIYLRSPGSDWELEQPNRMSVYKNGDLLVNKLLLRNRDQGISIEGRYSEMAQDSLILLAKAVDMSSFNPLLRLFSLKVNGILNSSMVFSKPNGQFIFRGNSEIRQFKLNGNSLGEVVLKTGYDNTQNVIRLEGYTSLGLGEMLGSGAYDMSFQGDYYLDRKTESLDLDFVAHTANLRLLNPLLEGFLTVNNGFVKGTGKIHGEPGQIKIDSKLRLFHSDIRVDYTGVNYYVTGDIEIMPDQIRFSELLLRDRAMNAPVQGVLNGNIFHNNFKDVRIDYDLNYTKMLVLNTTELDNPYYYGRVYGSGNLGIYGYLDNLNLEINTTVGKHSKFILPLDGPAELNDEDFIHFVVRDTIKEQKEKSISGLNLDMNLKVSPDAELSIIMDRRTGDALNVQGQGDLDLNINTFGKFDMKGDYVITDGNYQFSLKTLINKKFEIDAGSHITWSGDPLDAEIDVVARYRQRASVAPLLNDTTGQYGNRQPVDCKLLIAGKLANPDIHFDIDVPNIEPTAMARIENVLSDEAEMNRQVFSFLLFRNFVTPQIYTSQGGGVSAGSAAASTGSEMLSNRASEFLNSYFGNLTGITDMQVGVNYRPATGSNGEEFDVALSKQFMNNRINVDGNFGINTNPNNSSTGLIGDVTVEYKLSEDGRYRVKAFNQTNDNTQVTILGGPYTQGIGLFYREEFNTFRELLQYYKKKLGKSEKP